VTANWRTKPRGKYLIFFFPVSMECSGYVQKSYQGGPKKRMIKKLTDPTGEKRGKFCRIALVPKIKKIKTLKFLMLWIVHISFGYGSSDP